VSGGTGVFAVAAAPVLAQESAEAFAAVAVSPAAGGVEVNSRPESAGAGVLGSQEKSRGGERVCDKCCFMLTTIVASPNAGGQLKRLRV